MVVLTLSREGMGVGGGVGGGDWRGSRRRAEREICDWYVKEKENVLCSLMQEA